MNVKDLYQIIRFLGTRVVQECTAIYITLDSLIFPDSMTEENKLFRYRIPEKQTALLCFR